MNEREVFDAALAIADPDEQSSFLDRACGDNQSLRDHLRGLLEAHNRLGSFLQLPLPVVDVTLIQSPIIKAGSVIAGRYKLLEQIGEGGMGTVWVAEQTEPVKRRVALKLIKPGMDTRQVLSRFEAERQALALMDHPNIARVFDGGMTDEGRPYFVMEYVKGLPLTLYCDDTRLTVAQRLALFTQVCQAVQHAHQKGIIHRDLKPSNILVCLYDGQPVPKVIDFGLAKAMHQSLTEHTLYTAHGLMVGTPLYMSPEQAEFNNLDIDTRSDIYSLGVILYELLTGTTPLEKKQFKDAAWQEMVRLIKEEEPPRPSTRLSGSGSLPTLAAQRQLDPAKLTKALRGELDWIVMKALEKDRSRRYETANGLARDVQRYLADEPVEACPPSTGYRVRKFARRNMRALTTAALVGVTLLVVVGAVAGSIGWTVRDREARRTRLAGQLAVILDEVDDLEAAQKWPEALVAARRAESLLAGGGGDAEMQRQVQEVLADLLLVERLEEIRLETSSHQDNLYEWAERAYSDAFLGIGVDLNRMAVDEAVQQLQRRKQIRPALALILDQWSVWRVLSGNDSGAQALSAVAGQIDSVDPWRQRMRASSSEIRFKEGSNRAFGGLDHQSVEVLEQFANSPDLAGQPPTAIYNLGMALSQGGGNHELAIRVLRQGYRQYPSDYWINIGLSYSLKQLGPQHMEEAIGHGRAALALRPHVGWAWMRLGEACQHHYKRLDEANACYAKAIKLEPNNAWIHNYVGQGLAAQNKPDEAIAHFRKAIELDSGIASPHINLGALFRAQMKFDEAAACYRKAIKIKPNNASSYYSLGLTLLDKHRLLGIADDMDEAVSTLRKGVEIQEKNSDMWWALGRALGKQKKHAEAAACFQKGIEVNPNHARCHWGLGFLLLEQKMSSVALASFQQAVALNSNYGYSQYGLGLALKEQNRPAEAIAAFRKSVALDQKSVDAHYQLGVLLRQQNQLEEAVTCFRNAIELNASHAASHCQLGSILASQGKWDEGLAQLRKAAELNPSLAASHAELAWHLSTSADPKLRDPNAAVTHARRAVDLAPMAPDCWSRFGVALLRSSDGKAAVEALEKAARMWPDGDHQHRFFLAMAYWQLGEQDKARQAFEHAVQWMDQNQPDDKQQRRFRAEAAELLRISEPSDARTQ